MSFKFRSAVFGVLVLAFALSFDSLAQSDAGTFTAKNTVFLELGGNAGTSAWRHKVEPPPIGFRLYPLKPQP